ncbi:MAG TPA: flagellar export chaperone FliS [Methylophilaceae bacterium]|jgi:flagellar protein FliS
MFGASYSGINAYKRINLETGVVDADPLKLVIMLYDGAIEACHKGLALMRSGDIAGKGETLSKAITIVESGLRQALDRETGGEIARNLDELYGYISSRIYQGHLQNRPEYIEEAAKLLSELKSAWAAISERPAAMSQNLPQPAFMKD